MIRPFQFLDRTFVGFVDIVHFLLLSCTPAICKLTPQFLNLLFYFFESIMH